MADERNITPQIDLDMEPAYVERKRLLLFGLPWTFTKYTITPSLLTIAHGFFNTTEDDCYMYKIQDVKLHRSLIERILGLGTIVCYTGDVSHPEIRLVHIKHAKEIKIYLLKTSEEARLKRRTINTIDIGAEGLDMDGDGIAE